jgi:hypothetical protein
LLSEKLDVFPMTANGRIGRHAARVEMIKALEG